MFLSPIGWLGGSGGDANSHTHPNKDTLDKISEDTNGKLVFNNEQIDSSSSWESFDI